MKAMVLEQIGQPLVAREVAIPSPEPGEILLKVIACAVCRTDLHVVDGDLPKPKLPLIPGHQIIAKVEYLGANVTRFGKGDIVGVPWLGATCKQCHYCRRDHENLCDKAQFTGYQRDGGYAEYAIAQEDFCFAIPKGFPPHQAAPWLCAGLIGYRALSMAGDAEKIGLYGFGAAAHIIAQVIRYQRREFYGFTRPGDIQTQEFARQLGATWAGDTDQHPPYPLDAAIIFAPVGPLVPIALRHIAKGGTVICAGIHMSDIPSFPYSILWEERSIRSVANLTRKDGEEFLTLAPQIPITTQVHIYSLSDANRALDDLRHGRFDGAAVLQI